MVDPSLRVRVEACLVKVESGNWDECEPVLDLIVALCAYYREKALETAGI
jgi:hypothetical protein